MIYINLLPKVRKESLKRDIAALTACNKLIHWHDQSIIELQRREIECLKSMLKLRGVEL